MKSNPAVTPEPPPMPNASIPAWPLVLEDVATGLECPSWLKQTLLEDMRARDAMGAEKYGTTLRVQDGRNSGVDAYQEALDLCVYARKRAEQTGAQAWHTITGKAVWLAAAIRYQLAMEDDAEKEDT